MNTEKVIKRDQKYIMHTYARSPLVLEHGEGMYAYDADGKAYLDFTSGIGVNALGYCHPAWVQAVTMQATRLQHSSNLYYTAPCGKLAKRLCARTGLDQVFFGNSGAEANEGAIKCARKYSVTTYGPDRNKVLTLVNSFHGRTLATLTVLKLMEIKMGRILKFNTDKADELIARMKEEIAEIDDHLAHIVDYTVN